MVTMLNGREIYSKIKFFYPFPVPYHWPILCKFRPTYNSLISSTYKSIKLKKNSKNLIKINLFFTIGYMSFSVTIRNILALRLYKVMLFVHV